MDGEHIPVMEMDSSTSDPSVQFASWARHSANTELAPINRGGFLARGRVWSLGSVVVARAQLDPFVSDRTANLVNSTPAEHIQIVALHQGSVRLEADGLDQVCTAPDLFVRDYAEPSRATTTRISCTTVYLARDFLQQVTGVLGGQGVLPSSPETSVLGCTIATLVRNLPDAQLRSAPYYARTLRDVAAAALLNRGERTPKSQLNQLGRAKDYIAAQPPGTLSIEAMARQLGMSRTVLYDLFKRDGGVLSYDRLRRLRALYRALLDHTDRRSIAALGAERGFVDKTSLTRSFRTCFGCSPSDVRNGALRGETDDVPVAHKIGEAVARLA